MGKGAGGYSPRVSTIVDSPASSAGSVVSEYTHAFTDIEHMQWIPSINLKVVSLSVSEFWPPINEIAVIYI